MVNRNLKYLSVLLVSLFMISFITAQGCADEGWKGTSKIAENKTIQITCNTCTFINFSATNPSQNIFLDNVQMEKSGSVYSYVFLDTDLNVTGIYWIDGYSNLDVPLGLCFDVTPTGYDDDLPYIFVNFILFMFLIGAIVGVAVITRKIDFEKWNNKILSKYEDKNPVKVLFSGLCYCFMRDTFLIYYLLGFPLLIIIEDMMYTFNILSIHTLMINMIDLYSIGIIIAGLLFMGMAFQFLKETWDTFENMKWGVEK